MHFDTKLIKLFHQNFGEAYRSAKLLMSSFERMKHLIPLSVSSIKDLNPENLDMIDAFRVRFCDLQDSLGNKVFRSLLLLEEEQIGTGIDVINKMEKRGILESFDSFKKVRNIRNAFSHDYPDSDEAKIELLNDAYQNTRILIKILNNVIDYTTEKLQGSFNPFKKFEI